MKKKIILGDQAKEQLLEGAKLLYEAVSATLGPKGQNAVIEAYGEPIVTHDGVTVAKSIENVLDGSSGARVGVEMIKASSSKTNDNVGDGTTSSTILSYHLMELGMEKIKTGKNAMVLRRELESAKDHVLEVLDGLALPIKTEQETIEIATISSENADIGREVGTMYHKLGKDGMVVVEVGTKPETEYEVVEGYTIDRGVIAPTMIDDLRTQSTTIHNFPVLIVADNVGWREVAQVCNDAYNQGRDGIVIVCYDFKPDLLEQVVFRAEEFKIVGIKAPGFGDNRIELLKDLAAFTGGKVITNFNTDSITESLGAVDEIVATPNETVFTGGKDVSGHIKDLKALTKVQKSELDKEKINKRIANLNAKVGQIRVGGHTEMEAEEFKYLIDDAVHATDAALQDGIVPGGGTTYLHLARLLKVQTDGADLLRKALETPFQVLMTNAGLRYGKQLEKLADYEFGMGYDIMGEPEEVVDMKRHGIIDPVLVIKQSITNAVSVAGSALTTGVLITNEKEKEDFNEEKE